MAPKCDYSLSYATLEDLDGASGSWPAECLSYYMLGTLNNLLSEALDNYTSVNDGYDVSSPCVLLNTSCHADYITECVQLLCQGCQERNPFSPLSKFIIYYTQLLDVTCKLT